MTPSVKSNSQTDTAASGFRGPRHYLTARATKFPFFLAEFTRRAQVMSTMRCPQAMAAIRIGYAIRSPHRIPRRIRPDLTASHAPASGAAVAEGSVVDSPAGNAASTKSAGQALGYSVMADRCHLAKDGGFRDSCELLSGAIWP